MTDREERQHRAHDHKHLRSYGARNRSRREESRSEKPQILTTFQLPTKNRQEMRDLMHGIKVRFRRGAQDLSRGLGLDARSGKLIPRHVLDSVKKWGQPQAKRILTTPERPDLHGIIGSGHELLDSGSKMLGREACQHERKVQYVQRPISGDILPVNTHRAANWRQLCRTDGYNQQESSCNVLVGKNPLYKNEELHV